MDLTGWDRYLNGLHFFDERLDIDRFREALETMLTQYPLLAGKIAMEDSRVFIDFDGPGVVFSVERVDEPCPPFGPGVEQPNARALFHATPTGDPRHVARPLLLVKVTRFADGRYAVGVTNSPLLGDSYAAGKRFEDWHRHYAGLPVEPPAFSRAPLVALAQYQELPERRPTAAPVAASASGSFTTSHSTIYVSPDERALLQDIGAGGAESGAFAFTDVLHALIIKSYAAARAFTQSNVTATITYSVRSIDGLGLPLDYQGNTVLHRFAKVPSTIAGAPVAEVAATLAELCKNDATAARHLIGLFQHEYEAGHVSEHGTLERLQAPFGEAGLRINAITHSGPTAFSFGGHALWSEPVFMKTLPIRLAMTYPDRAGGLTLMLALPEEEAARFRSAWSRSIEELAASRVLEAPMMESRFASTMH